MFMKILKKSKAIIAAMLVIVAILVCAMPVYATTKTDALYIGLYKATCILESANEKQGVASTVSSTKRWDEMYAGIIGRRVNTKKEFVKYENYFSEVYNSKTTNKVTISIGPSSNDYFETITSVHAISSGSNEKGTTLLIQYNR